jgi:uncharacterized membrane protein YeiH
MHIQYLLELTGTCFFAMSGALVATRKSEQDWFGVTFIGFITAIGGGSLRDILLGSYPLVWVQNVNFLYAIFIGIVLTRLFYNTVKKRVTELFIFDTLGIAMFTILGTEKALYLDVNPVIAAIMGMLSAVMGGVIRDVLTNEIPVLFRKEVYASACLAGATLYLVLDSTGVGRNYCYLLSIALISVIRYLAVKYNLSLPKFKV